MRAGLLCLLLLWALPAAAGVECWSGWGYRVAPGTLAFRGERMLLVTPGPADWRVGEEVTLLPLDPESGRIDPNAATIHVRPRRPRFFSTREGNRAMDDVADIVGEDSHLMLGMTRVGPAVSGTPRQEAFLRWACGRE
ncbi:hypothetical protein [Ferruginivarius sediminum]|uniref:DUF2147 domain-containing protein n=1 Tax=Ferruginivarius sediminum TaxID=2661937 RepID=A0A369T8L8_9PROT|nr:hypothetical protein [Ferruginivarius sediminum]RDD61669.1 hypothetical protein DRB17_12120 [Ferruginivarius sediminum]